MVEPIHGESDDTTWMVGKSGMSISDQGSRVRTYARMTTIGTTKVGKAAVTHGHNTKCSPKVRCIIACTDRT